MKRNDRKTQAEIQSQSQRAKVLQFPSRNELKIKQTSARAENPKINIPGFGDVGIVGYRTVPAPMNARPDDKFVMTNLKGHSLERAGLKNGDWILWRMCDVAQTGDLVVVGTPFGETVKFYHPCADGFVQLRTSSEDCSPQVWLVSEVKIRGVVVMSGRDYTDSGK